MILRRKVDRLERLVKAIIRTGRRLRTDLRAQEEKIGIVINTQIQTEDQLSSLRENVSDYTSELQEARKEIDQRLNDLTEAVNNLRSRN